MKHHKIYYGKLKKRIKNIMRREKEDVPLMEFVGYFEKDEPQLDRSRLLAMVEDWCEYRVTTVKAPDGQAIYKGQWFVRKELVH